MEVKEPLLHGNITERILGAAMEVHRVLGPGFLEAVYEEALGMELNNVGLRYDRQKELSIYYKNTTLQHRYRADLIVEDKIIVNTKATSGLTEIDEAQVFNYLKATTIKVGLLLNFGKRSLEWKRLICETYFDAKE
ncbi:MAG: GxxExxY protein [Candidatus Aureabacteria bacterium]|nr:GxxExxY protein [Candidatus Auribacterota bacterium]